MLIRRLARLFSNGNASPRPARLAAFEALEDRILLAAQPVVALDVPATALIGGDVQATATFTNVPDGAPGSANGFGPVLDLILPHNGADGAGVGSTPPFQNDGITLSTASYLGINLAIAQVEFDAAGNAAHPYLRDAAGQPLIVTGTPGDMLAAIQLPFGSVTPGQTPIAVQLGLQVSNLADADTPLPITARGAFQFGRDAESNPATDPPVLGSFTPPANITPTVMQLSKSFSGPEGETVTGPNSPRSYTITLGVAPGQTITGVNIEDQFADGIVVHEAGIVAPGGTVSFDAGANRLTVDYAGPITGGVSITVPFHVGQVLAPTTPADPVLPPVSGASRAMGNDVSATADWTPLDPRDPTTTITLDPPGFENVFTAKSLAVQKSVALQNDVLGNGIGPDDTLQYTLRGQVSDYFSFDNLLLTDLLGDGQRLDLGFAPVITLHEGATDLTAGITPGSFSLSRSPTTGVSTLAFDLSQWLLDNGGDALLNGDATGTLGVTSFTITYRAIIERSYLAPPQGPVAQNDSLGNQVSFAGRVDLDGTPGGVTGGDVTDTSQSGVTVTAGASSKSVYALNGQLVAGPVTIVSGDTVTFRLTRSFPQGTVTDFSLTDFLPLPIFNVGQQSFTFADVVSAAAPADGMVQWGPSAAAFRTLYGAVPTLTTSLAANALTFDFGDIGDGTPSSTTLDLLFTVRVLDRPLGDQLLLTNLATAQETNSAGGIITDNDIAQVTLSEPKLKVYKGVVATDDPDGVYSPGAVGPVTFNAPGSSGLRFAGVINSINLAATPVDSDLSGVDAGARVTFAVLIENTGTGKNGAFDITLDDLIPQQLSAAPGGLNLQVTDGAGNALTYTLDLNTGIGARLTLNDLPGAGALSPFDPTSGRNIVVITFDTIVAQQVEPRSLLTNKAIVSHYAAFEGGLNRAPNQPAADLTDTASVEITAVSLAKQVVETSLSETGSGKGNASEPDLAIGETVTFEITVTLPEGQVRDLVLSDLLPLSPGKLKLLEASILSIGANITGGGLTVGQAGVLSDRNTDGLLDTASWTATGVVNNQADGADDARDRIVLRVKATVPDVPDNTAGDRLINTGQATYALGSNGTATEQATAAVEIVEPRFALTKTVTPTTAVGGNTVQYTIALEAGPNQSFAGPAYNVTLDDALIPGKVTLTGPVTVTVNGVAQPVLGSGVSVTIPVLLPTDRITLTFDGLLDPAVIAGEQLVNTVTGTALSAPNPAALGTDQRSYLAFDTATVQVPGAGIAKVVTATSNPDTGSNIYNSGIPDLLIGERVDFTITLTLPRALNQSLTLTDLLPNNAGVSATSGVLQYVTSEVLSIGSSLTGSLLAVGAAGVFDAGTNRVTFNFGDVQNSAAGALTANETITLLVRARLVDSPGNVAADILTNTATVTSDTGAGGVFTRTATARVEVVEPSLTLDKSGNLTSGDAGDVVTYTVSVPRGNTLVPAYDLVISDPLAADLQGLAGTGVIVSGPVGAAISFSALTNSFTVTAASYLPSDDILTFTYQARIRPSAFPAEVITNTAAITWDSQPGTPVAPEVQRSYGPATDSYSLTVPAVVISKEVGGTSNRLTSADQFDPLITDLVIGEQVFFTITLDVPEGTTTLSLTDFLPVASGSATLSGRLVYSSSQVAEIGSNISGSLLAVGAAGVYDAATNSVTFNFGTVVNQADNVGDGRDRITVTVIATLGNLPENQVGDTLTNVATVTYTGGSASDTARVEIVGPLLQVTKAADRATADAGDIITFTITIPQDPGATSEAVLVYVTDTLAPGLELIPHSVTITGLPRPPLTDGLVLVGNSDGDTYVQTVYVSRRFGDPLPTITYQALVTDAAVVGTTITNTANLDYSSWITADGRPAPTLTATASFTLPVPSLAKAVASTGLTQTGTSQFDPTVPDLALGETVTYRLTATLVEGTQNLVIADTLPNGLTPLSATVVSLGAGMTNTAGLVAGSLGVITGQGVSFDFGTVVAPGDNIAINNSVIVEVVARAVDVGGLTAGTTLTNSARLDHGAGFGAAVTAPVEIVLPDLLLTKSVAAPASGDAGDLMTYTVTVAHSGTSTGPAFDLTLTDLLASEKLLYVAGSATATLGGAAVGSFDTTGGDLRFSLGTLGLTAGTLTLTYQARLADTVEPGGLVVNSVALVYDTAPGVVTGEREFTPPPETASVTVVMPATLDKSITATSLAATPDGEVAPGETITYTLVTTLSEGTQKLVVADLLPGGLEVLSASVVGFGHAGITNSAGLVAGSAGAIAGQGVTFDFGTVVNPGDNNAANNSVTVQILARVRDSAPGGAVLTNAATATITDTAGANAQNLADNVSVTVVLPDLLLTKSVAAPASGDAGDLMTYTVTVAHSGSSTGPAFDLTLTDLLASEKLLYVAGSATATLGGAAVGSFDTTGGDLRFSLGTLGLTAGTLTLTYQARLADTVEPGGLVVNSVALVYDTAPGVVTGEREFTPPPETASVTVVMPATLDKSITATSLAATPDGEVAPGETITYTLVTTLSEGTQKLVVADLLPGGLEVLSANVVGFGHAGITNSAGLVAGSAGAIAGQGVTFDFGTVVNPGDNNAANNSVTVQILARVRDATAGGAVLTNAATAIVTDTTGSNAQNLADNVSVTVVAPILAFEKTLQSYTPGDAGTEAIFVLTLSHATGSTGPAFGSITDILPSGLRDAVILSVTGPAGPASVVGGSITIPIAAAGFLPSDPNIIIRFAARLADSVEHQVTVTNEASATYRPSPGGGIPVTLTDDASLLPLFTPGFTKTLSATDNPDTAGSAVAIGEVVTYRLRALLAEGTQRLLLTDALPAGMRLMDATIRYDSAAISAPAFADGAVLALSGTSLSLDFGTVVNRGDNLAGNDMLDVFVRARVVDTPGVDAGRTLLNNAVLTPSTTASLPIGAPIPGATPVQVVEPLLVLAKSVEGFARPGETAPYTLVLGHAGTSTAAAYDVTLADLLATAGLSLVPGSASVSDNAAGATGASVTSNIGTLGVFVPRLALGEVVTIRFDAAIAPSVAPTSSLPNTANVQWTSSPGATPGERGYAGEASALLPLAPVLTKAIIATSLAETGAAQFNPSLPDLAIGETVTFRISLLLPQAVLGNVTLTDVLPEGLIPLSAQVESVGTAISGITAGSAGAIAGQAVSFGFGTVVNAGSAAIGAEDHVTLLVTARATEANAAGRILTNTAQLDFTLRGEAGIERASASAEIVTPLLTIAKTVTPDFQSPGQPVTHGLTINHLAASTQDAFDVTISDLALGSSVERGSVVVTGATLPATVAYVGTGFTVSLARLALGETLGITYRAILDLVPPITGEVVNTALVQGDSLPEGAGIPQFLTGASDQARVLVASGLPPEAVTEGGLLSSYRGISPNLTTFIRPDIGFAGAAAPGTLLVISLRDSLGRIVTSVDALADFGGNWLASIPSLTAPGSQLPNTGDYLGATRLFTNLVGGFGGGTAPLNPVTPFGDLSTSPYTVEVTIRRGLGESFGETAMNSRIYFQDLTTGGAFVSDGGLTIRDVFANTPSQSIRNAAASMIEPYSFSINKFTAEFLSAGAIPGVANR
jgi:large repetitive protein